MFSYRYSQLQSQLAQFVFKSSVKALNTKCCICSTHSWNFTIKVMSTQTIRTIRQRWVTLLLGEDWRNPVVNRLRRLLRKNARSQVTSTGSGALRVRLGRNELVCLHQDCGRHVIHVRQGIVWLTGTPACGDVILFQGDRLVFDERWQYVFQALQEAEIDLLG